MLVTAYALDRPDGQWSLMLINKDYEHPHSVRIRFHDSDASRDASFTGKVTMITFGKEQYQWHPNRKQGYADPDGAPQTRTLQAAEDMSYSLPAASVTELRGALGTPLR